MRYATILIVALIVHATVAFFGNSLKKIKQKAKDAYKKKFGKDKTWHFLGFDLSEYPGTNEMYRQINIDKWNDYYACLLAQNTSVGHDSSATPEAIQVIESSSIRLECKLCVSPLETTKLDSVEWYWAADRKIKLKPVEYEENILLSPTDKALQIYNLQDKHSGQYMCRIGEAEAPPYFLTVVSNEDKDLEEVHPVENPTGPHPEDPVRIGRHNLIVDTEWGPWTSCSKCNQIGRRHKFGYCIVKHEENRYDEVKSDNETDADAKTPDISTEDLHLLKIFKFGVPCKSHILPNSLKRIEQVVNRKNEIMTGYCKTDCPQDEVFEVRDKSGKVIERANNSAGIYSMLQGIPTLQPPVERLLQYAEKGKEAVLACPGNLNSDVPVQWQVGSKKLIPELIVAESNGRIYISITDKIHIKDAKISDSNLYSCWQQDNLAGTVRLIVEKVFVLNFNHHIMLLGSIMIFATFAYVLVKAFLRRKAARTAT